MPRHGITRDQCGELAPSGVVDTLGQASILDHILDGQIVDSNQVKLVDDATAVLVSEIRALASSSFVGACHHLASLLSVLPCGPFLPLLPPTFPHPLPFH